FPTLNFNIQGGITPIIIAERMIMMSMSGALAALQLEGDAAREAFAAIQGGMSISTLYASAGSSGGGGGNTVNNDAPQSGDTDETKSYKLPGDVDNVFDGKQGPQECAFYSLEWIERYLKSNKGKNGGPRSYKDFKRIQKSVTNLSLQSLLENTGLEFRKAGSILDMGISLNKGYPVLATEHLGNIGHQVVIVEIDYNANNPSESDVKVYNSMTGQIESRYNYFGENGSPSQFYIGIPS